MKIIVSLTTYPARINTIDRCLDAMIKQTIKPDKIVLYLAATQFPDKKLPFDVEEYQKHGCEVRWCDEDLGPHKKYYYAMKEFPEDIIITIDDDFWYPETLVEDLVRGYKKFPKCIITRCAHLVTALPDGNIAPYGQWYIRCERYVNEPKMSLFAVGCGGILYPPGLLPEEVFNRDAISKCCWHADDLWLKTMELISRIPTVLVTKWFEDRPMKEYADDGLYVNVNRDGGNDAQLAELLKEYNKYGDSQDTLVDRVFADGKLLASEAKKGERNWGERVVNEFLSEIKKEKSILIYGAGVIAKRLFTIMSGNEYDLSDKVKAFIVSDVTDNAQDIDGKPICSWQAFASESEKIILGMSADKQEEVYRSLETKGIDRERIIKIDEKTSKALKTVEKLEKEKRKAADLQELKERANNCRQIVIYGAGIYGKRVLKRLHEWNIYKKTVFAVTGTPEETEVMGVDVYDIKSYADAEEDIFIIPAVGDALTTEMVSYLEKLRVKNYMPLTDELRNVLKESMEDVYKRMLKQQPQQRILENTQSLQKEQNVLKQQQQQMLSGQGVLEQQQRKVLESQQQSMVEQQKQSTLEQQQNSLLEQQQELLKEIYQSVHQLAERIERLENSGIQQAENGVKLDAVYDMLKRKA